MSSKDRHLDLLIGLVDGAQNSAQRKKAKNAKQHAAHSIALSKADKGCRLLFSDRNIRGVIGSRGVEWTGFTRWIPFITSSKRGEFARGLLWPLTICRCRTPAK